MTDTDRDEIIEALRRSEATQRHLLAELQHRVRNNLAVIRSVVRRTAEASETLEDFTAYLEGRLGALSRAQSAATCDPARGIDLRMLVDDELLAAAAMPPAGSRVTVDGPDLRIRAKAAQTLALVFHELATDAVERGAVSDGGVVAVTWRIDGEALIVRWLATSRDSAPSRLAEDDFSAELLEQTLPYELDATVECEADTYILHLPMAKLII